MFVFDNDLPEECKTFLAARLAFGHVVYHYKSHTHAASSLARCSRWFRASEMLLLLGVTITAVAAAFGTGRAYTLASAGMAALALLIFLIHVTFDFESTARAHHVCSTRLWSVREQYRALLCDLNDHAIEPDVARVKPQSAPTNRAQPGHAQVPVRGSSAGSRPCREDGDPLLTVEGSVTNVVGLPMESLAEYLVHIGPP